MELVYVMSFERANFFARHLNDDAQKNGDTYDSYSAVEYGGDWAVAFFHEGRLVGYI